MKKDDVRMLRMKDSKRQARDISVREAIEVAQQIPPERMYVLLLQVEFERWVETQKDLRTMLKELR